jgi:hypothetical protein
MPGSCPARAIMSSCVTTHCDFRSRFLRMADMQIFGALLQVPLNALRDLYSKVKVTGWHRLTTVQTPGDIFREDQKVQ